ncbi:MAG: VWA domain-containing protein [Candidatus Cloacimonadota bacterium]
MIRLAEPWFLTALLLIPLYLYLELKLREKSRIRLPFSRLDILSSLVKPGRFWSYLFPILNCLIIASLALALARPQWGRGIRDISQRGVDIVISVDVSGSMLAMDFAPDNRLGAAVAVAKDFIAKRPNDRFSLVAFSEYAITQSPLTFDHQAMQDQLDKLEVNAEASGTAIGMGLAKAVARLQDSRAKSKLIILITDGVNNSGEVDPISAARMARALGVKVYPIGVGSNGLVNFPFAHPLFGIQYQRVRIELDMETLDKIAEITGTGKAALASDASQFRATMKEIDQMEKTEYQVKLNYNWSDRYQSFLWIALILLLIEFALKLLVIPKLPD